MESAHNHAPSTSHLEAILATVVHNALGLVQDCQGVRIVNVFLEEFRSSHRVTPLIETLLADPSKLEILIVDEFANFAISAALDVEHERICQVVCTRFVEYALDKYATHVVRKCIDVATDLWVTCFNELFIIHCDELASRQQQISSCVRRTLEISLSKRKMRSQLEKLRAVRGMFMKVSL